MNVSLGGFVLFLHIAVVITSFMIAAVLHTGLNVLPRLATVAQARPWARIVHRLEPLLPILAVVILVLGAWLVHLEHGDGVGWSDAWVLVPLITLIAIEGLAGAVLAPRTKALVARIEQGPDGLVSPDLRDAMLDPVIWDVAHIASLGFTGVVFVMTVKPAGSIAWLFPVVGAVIGIALSRWQLDLARRAVSQGPAGSAIPSQRDTPAEEPSTLT